MQKEPNQPWEGEKFPVKEGDRCQLGKHEGAGLSADCLSAQSLPGILAWS